MARLTLNWGDVHLIKIENTTNCIFSFRSWELRNHSPLLPPYLCLEMLGAGARKTSPSTAEFVTSLEVFCASNKKNKQAARSRWVRSHAAWRGFVIMKLLISMRAGTHRMTNTPRNVARSREPWLYRDFYFQESVATLCLIRPGPSAETDLYAGPGGSRRAQLIPSVRHWTHMGWSSSEDRHFVYSVAILAWPAN